MLDYEVGSVRENAAVRHPRAPLSQEHPCPPAGATTNVIGGCFERYFSNTCLPRDFILSNRRLETGFTTRVGHGRAMCLFPSPHSCGSANDKHLFVAVELDAQVHHSETLIFEARLTRLVAHVEISPAKRGKTPLGKSWLSRNGWMRSATTSGGLAGRASR